MAFTSILLKSEIYIVVTKNWTKFAIHTVPPRKESKFILKIKPLKITKKNMKRVFPSPDTTRDMTIFL